MNYMLIAKGYNGVQIISAVILFFVIVIIIEILINSCVKYTSLVASNKEKEQQAEREAITRVGETQREALE